MNERKCAGKPPISVGEAPNNEPYVANQRILNARIEITPTVPLQPPKLLEMATRSPL